jgi:hypothetical protein
VNSYKKKAKIAKKQEGLKMKIEKRYSTHSMRKAQPLVESEWVANGGYVKGNLSICNNFNSGERLRLRED